MKKESKKSGIENRITMKTIKRGMAALLAGCLLTGALAACGGDNKDDSSSTGSGLASVPPLAATAAPTPASTAKAVKVTKADVLNIRASSNTESEILRTVDENTVLPLMSETQQDGWYQIQYQGVTGYVHSDYVDVVDITIQQYQDLIAGPAATPTPEPDGSPTPDGGASQGDGATPTSGLDNEDGE